jgi:hypothetical protein
MRKMLLIAMALFTTACTTPVGINVSQYAACLCEDKGGVKAITVSTISYRAEVECVDGADYNFNTQTGLVINSDNHQACTSKEASDEMR